MYIKDIFKVRKPTLSFEVFPPKKSSNIASLFETVAALKQFNPDFISVTYGAGGGTRSMTTEIASTVKNDHNIEALAHLTCIASTCNEIADILKSLKQNNVTNILALRGDVPDDVKDNSMLSEFMFASELIEYIHTVGGFCVGGACYPEGHVESTDKIKDILNLKHKIERGVDFLITQLFFDNEMFYSFMEKLSLLEVKVPVIAGILPVLNVKQIKRIQELSGCSLPKKFIRILDKYQNNPAALEEAGIAYAAEQIVDLLSWGVDGVHIYTMNRPDAARSILNGISHIRSTLTAGTDT